MSLCIAALADENSDNPKIVLSSDMLLGDDYHKIETQAKSDVGFSDTLAALYSGNWDEYTNLGRILTRTVRANQLTLDNYRIVLNEAWKEFETTLTEDRRPHTDAQCIIAGFIEEEPRIIRIQKGAVDTLPYWATIGIGAYHADTILSWRKITQFSSLEQVLYFVYEAKRFGELCKDVGRGTIMEILGLDDSGGMDVDLVMADGLNIMEGWFRNRFGTREVGYDLSFTPTAFHRVKPD